jgi:predicted HTH domain antitoxin
LRADDDAALALDIVNAAREALGFVQGLDLPEEVASALRRSPEEFTADLRLAAAIHWYARGEMSQEKAARIAGLDRTDFLFALAREEIDAFAVDFDELESIREYDTAKASGEEAIPLDQAVAEIESPGR